jgi:two-component system sensor histidine kinase SenX3
MRITRRKKSMFFFIALGVCMLGATVTLSAGWLILNWREWVPLAIGVPFFALLIVGVTLNTIFLVREVRRNEQQDSFLNAVTHELKTPLASIHLYLETLKLRELSEGQRQEFYSIMLADSNRLLAMVEQVLKAGEIRQRPASNRVRIPVDMGELLAASAATTLQRHHLEAGTIEVMRFDALPAPQSAAPALVLGNPEDLQTAILNVLDNAVKYANGKVDIQIRLNGADTTWVRFSIADQGMGIPAGQLKRIFLRFYRVPNRNLLHVKGTGLGLFLVRNIVQQHGGEVYAESAGEGRGATIHFQLPRALPAAKDSAVTTRASLPA